jgi:hypothetical protein
MRVYLGAFEGDHSYACIRHGCSYACIYAATDLRLHLYARLFTCIQKACS